MTDALSWVAADPKQKLARWTTKTICTYCSTLVARIFVLAVWRHSLCCRACGRSGSHQVGHAQ